MSNIIETFDKCNSEDFPVGIYFFRDLTEIQKTNKWQIMSSVCNKYIQLGSGRILTWDILTREEFEWSMGREWYKFRKVVK